MLKEKLIVTDVDGVCLDWEYAFERWMSRHGHKKLKHNSYDLSEHYGLEKEYCSRLVRIFNESAAAGFIAPYKDAKRYIDKLHTEKGVVFHAITSMSLEPYAHMMRQMNIENLFGKTAFEKITYCDCGASKEKELEQYRDSGLFFLEDKPSNAEYAKKIGMDPILFTQHHNRDYKGSVTRKVETWENFFFLYYKGLRWDKTE